MSYHDVSILLAIVDLGRDSVHVPHTYILYASILRLFELCKLLLERGSDVNAQGGLYGNALQTTAFRGDEAIVLLERGTDVTLTAESAPRCRLSSRKVIRRS